MNHFKKTFLLILFFVLAFSTVIHSLTVPARPEGRVNDWAGMLSPDARANLEQKLAAYESQTGSQIVVVTFPSLEGESLEDFSIHLAEKWKIGRKGKDDGVILLIFRDEKRIRIEVGYGLEGVLTDATSSYIIRRIMAPKFKAGDIDGGVTDAVDAIMKVVSGEVKPMAEEANFSSEDIASLVTPESIKKIVAVVLIILGVLFLIDLLRFGGYRAGRKNYRQRYSFFEWMLIFSVVFFVFKLIFWILEMLAFRGGGFGGGSGGFGGSSSGGFSGGGGGFGGGGASGGW